MCEDPEVTLKICVVMGATVIIFAAVVLTFIEIWSRNNGQESKTESGS